MVNLSTQDNYSKDFNRTMNLNSLIEKHAFGNPIPMMQGVFKTFDNNPEIVRKTEPDHKGIWFPANMARGTPITRQVNHSVK